MAFMEEKNSLKFNEVPVGSTFNVAREKPADRRAEYLQMSMEWQAVSSSSRGAHGVVGFVARFSARSENYPLEVLPHWVYCNNKVDGVKLGYSREVLGRTF